MKVWMVLKTAIYTTLAICVLIFAKAIINVESEETGYIHFLVGGIMLLYGLELVIMHFVKKKKISEDLDFYWGVLEVMMGIIMLVYLRNQSNIYIIWAVWAIFGVAREVREAVEEMTEKGYHLFLGSITIIESIVVIVLSVLLIMEPAIHHALTHMYLLFAELLIMVWLPFVRDMFSYHFKKEEKEKKLENK